MTVHATHTCPADGDVPLAEMALLISPPDTDGASYTVAVSPTLWRRILREILGDATHHNGKDSA